MAVALAFLSLIKSLVIEELESIKKKIAVSFFVYF